VLQLKPACQRAFYLPYTDMIATSASRGKPLAHSGGIHCGCEFTEADPAASCLSRELEPRHADSADEIERMPWKDRQHQKAVAKFKDCFPEYPSLEGVGEAKSDELRQELEKMGYEVKDTKEGTQINKK
jgi:hypothetical protein